MTDALKGSLFKLKSLRKLVKLRPFVHTFLKEASQLFEMYIYTMAERSYALEMANLLDPQKIYFDSRIIARHDCTQRRQKGLDVVLGQESAVLILDDSHQVWAKDKANLILMEKYNYFASSYINLPYKYKSLSELKYDESESEGTLAIVLQVLKRIHNLFFDPELGDNFAGRDVRQVLMAVRGEILKGCKIAFSCTFLPKSPEQNHRLWNMAEQMGAMCVKEVDPSVTHVVSAFVGTRKSCWAVEQNKFLVEPRWLEAAYYLWQKQPEDKFTVLDDRKKRMLIVSVDFSRVRIRIRNMSSNDDEGYKLARTQTPLSSIAQAFEEISDLIKNGNGNEVVVDLKLKPFCEACSLVSVLFGCLGMAFKFAEMEYTAKLRDLLEASKSFDTLSSVVEFDLKNKTVKSPGSHTRNLRRVRQGLDLIKELFQNFLSPENLTLKTAATTAYQQVCAPYHTWAVRTAASAGMCTLPSREQLLLNLNETDKSADKEMRRYIKASQDVIKIIDDLYISRGITLDW
ncbi:hypothetical protein QVD17_21009 [Tagetes erecta]|uniref:RNA polymerase II C-terminal domain phosphatase-like n=1 Tax=Tagetes erecta TaxID=13708 RepID=A0AAD8KMA5_TARER|nr:hypothetical protein QVD17_21009 [Tagetes erecta]